VTTIDIASTGAQPEASSSAARQRWFELCLVLLVACGTAFLNALNVLKNGTNAVPHMTSDKWLIGIVQEVTALLLLGYVLSRRSLRFKDLGLRWSLGDVGVGLLVAGSSFAAYLLGSTVVHVFHYAIYGVMAGGPALVPSSHIRLWRPFHSLS
jgi:hypothetical protein